MTKGLRAALAGCLVSGALLVSAGGRAWATVGYADRARTVPGSAFVGSLAAWGLLALAGVVAVPATRRWGRVPVGGALVAAGATVAALTAAALRDAEARALAHEPLRRVTVPAGDVGLTAWPYVALAAGLLLAATGVLVALRGPRWAALSARYDVPAERPVTDADLWAAQDRGEDPTA